MVDEFGRARITDFGLATIARNPHSQLSALGDEGHTARWSAPEILKTGQHSNKESDVFSFGMVIIEVGDDRSAPCQPTDPLMKIFTGAAPFGGERTPAVIAKIMTEEIPERPMHPGLRDRLWELTKRCLGPVPSNRPRMEEVQETLRDMVRSGGSPPNRVDAPPSRTRKGDTNEALSRRVVVSSPLKCQERRRVNGQPSSEKVFASGNERRCQRLKERTMAHLSVEKLHTSQRHQVRSTNTEKVSARWVHSRDRGTFPLMMIHH